MLKIFLIALACWCLLRCIPAAEPLAAWQELFNGKDLRGWVAEGSKEFSAGSVNTTIPVWTVNEGLLTCAGSGFGFLRYDRELTDFCLRVEFRMGGGCNSGIGIRHAKYDERQSTATRPSYSGYEIQLLDSAGQPPDDHGTGSLYRYVAPRSNPIKPAGEWNVIEIECRGPRIKIVLNDQLIQDVNQSAVAAIKEKSLKGFISLQNHGKLIDFRKVQLQELVTVP